MDLIYNKKGLRYHEVHIYRLLHNWEFKSKVPQKRFVNTTSKRKEIQKRVNHILRNRKNWNIVLKDESIFVYDDIFKRKKWISAEKRPIITVTGCRKKTVVFGCLSIVCKQLFLQYDKFNSNTFVDYLKHKQKKFGKCIIFVDRATPHCSAITRKYKMKIKI